MSQSPLTNRESGRIVIDTLYHLGVRHFFMSPGARSSPLVAALAEIEDIEVTIHYDERGMSFAALGHAMATGLPSVCITTSGSAVANLLPACVEASHSGLPVVFITADRPPELRGTGANQTILQPGIFGTFVRLSRELPCAENDFASKESLVESIYEAVAVATGENPGPVHINMPIREPLLENEDAGSADPLVFPKFQQPPITPSPISCGSFFSADYGVVVIGRLSACEQVDVPEIIEWAVRLGWPIFCDALSGARLMPGIIRHGDWILQQSHIPRPNRVLHFGGALVSKRIGKWLSACRECDYIQVRESPLPLDPWDQKPNLIRMGILDFCRMFPNPSSSSPHWSLAWKSADTSTERVLQQQFEGGDTLSEPEISRLIARAAFSLNHTLFLANSMPVRDFDSSAESFGTKLLPVFGNRGASGIDGNIATIAGVAMASDRSVLAVIGDLAALHDLNSLPLLLNQSVTLVIVNNHGGGIFRFLPLAVSPDKREKYWETPHPFGFADAAAQFGIEYHNPTSVCALKECLSSVATGPRIVECVTDRDENARLHKSIADQIRELDFKWPH